MGRHVSGEFVSTQGRGVPRGRLKFCGRGNFGLLRGQERPFVGGKPGRVGELEWPILEDGGPGGDQRASDGGGSVRQSVGWHRGWRSRAVGGRTVALVHQDKWLAE